MRAGEDYPALHIMLTRLEALADRAIQTRSRSEQRGGCQYWTFGGLSDV